MTFALAVIVVQGVVTILLLLAYFGRMLRHKEEAHVSMTMLKQHDCLDLWMALGHDGARYPVAEPPSAVWARLIEETKHWGRLS